MTDEEISSSYYQVQRFFYSSYDVQIFIGKFGEPENPEKLFASVCVNCQENALSPGEATPAGPFLWKRLSLINATNPQNL